MTYRLGKKELKIFLKSVYVACARGENTQMLFFKVLELILEKKGTDHLGNTKGGFRRREFPPSLLHNNCSKSQRNPRSVSINTLNADCRVWVLFPCSSQL